jgi:hypothetical protein
VIAEERKALSQPDLTFFCELEPAPLLDLFSKPEVIHQLKSLQANISLGLLDLSVERARVVRKLNQEGIPVTAWLLLPKEQGYWFNLENAQTAINRYSAFKLWSAENDLHWKKIGLDIEPDIRLIQETLRNGLAGAKKMLSKLLGSRRVREAVCDYRALVSQMRLDGYFVESYQLPFIIDERKANSIILQRLGGLVDLEVDCEVLMLYTSFLRPYGAGILWEYAREGGGVGVGNTGGGVKMEGFKEPQYLQWTEIRRDLLLARQHTENIYLFSLEGCVLHGFMEKLVHFDWNQNELIPVHQARQVGRVRKLAQGMLWAISHPIPVLAATIGIFWLFRKIRL